MREGNRLFEILRAASISGTFETVDTGDFRADVVYNPTSVNLVVTSGVSVEEAAEATALVKVVDERGLLIKCDARKLFKVTEDALVVVAGKAKRDDAGNLTVLASGVYVRR